MSGISGIGSSGNLQQVSGSNPFAKVKQDFDALGSALDSGNLTDAKKAFAQLQKDAPSQGGKKNPLSDTIDSLGKALDSGDLKGAQDAYGKIKEAMSQKQPTGGQGGGAGGAGGASGASGAGGGSSSNKTYDVKDTNKDGTVSAMEELVYDLAHSQQAKNGQLTQATQATSNSTANGVAGETIDIQA